MTAQKINPIDLFKKAVDEATIQEEVKLNFGGEEGEQTFILTAPDMFEILKDQEVCYQEAYADCEKKLGGKPINEKQWLEGLKDIKDADIRKRMENKKPFDLADQVAQKNARFETVRVLIPRILKYKSGELVANNDEEREIITKFISQNMPAFTALTNAYVQLMTRISDVDDKVKNSNGQDISETS